jgi:hypothetical protein
MIYTQMGVSGSPRQECQRGRKRKGQIIVRDLLQLGEDREEVGWTRKKPRLESVKNTAAEMDARRRRSQAPEPDERIGSSQASNEHDPSPQLEDSESTTHSLNSPPELINDITSDGMDNVADEDAGS